MDAFMSIKHLLSKQIELMDQQKENYVLNPKKDFSRKRKLLFSDMLSMIINMESGTIRSELHKFFCKNIFDAPTPSAFVQQRKKIKPVAFFDLFHRVTERLPAHSESRYHFLAVDGTILNIPLEGEVPEYSYIRKRPDQGSYHQLRLNAIYDLEQHYYIDGLLTPRKGTNERDAFDIMLEKGNFPKNSVFIFDRGYEGYPIMANIINHGHYFVIRAKDGNVGIIKGLGLTKEKEYDYLFDKILVNKIRKEYTGNTAYHCVHATYKDYFLNLNRKEYPMRFRVVRLLLDNGSYECLLTNLPKEEFGLPELREIYHKRWGIETSFRHLKQTLGLLDFHSKQVELIEQEIWAKMICYNCCMAMIHTCKKKKSTKKYNYAVNVTNALHLCRNFLRSMIEIELKKIKRLIFQAVLPIRPKRSVPRKSTFERTHGFNYRVL